VIPDGGRLRVGCNDGASQLAIVAVRVDIRSYMYIIQSCGYHRDFRRTACLAGLRNAQPHTGVKKPTTATGLKNATLQESKIEDSLQRLSRRKRGQPPLLFTCVSPLDSVFRHSRFAPGAAVHALEVWVAQNDFCTV
jgi:hypothetical protein